MKDKLMHKIGLASGGGRCLLKICSKKINKLSSFLLILSKSAKQSPPPPFQSMMLARSRVHVYWPKNDVDASTYQSMNAVMNTLT